MYNAKVTFSLFPSPSERNQIFAMESNRQNYSRVFVSRGFYGWESGRKKDTALSLEFKMTSIYL